MPFLDEQIISIIHEACAFEEERPWIEFKLNQATTPMDIGEYISALSNTAALYNKTHALMIWGLMTKRTQSVGRSFDHRGQSRGIRA